MQERNFLFRQYHQFRNDLHPFQLLIRKLCLHLKRADSLDVVAEEVDTERQLIRVGIDIYDAAAHGKLSRFVDVVGLGVSRRSSSCFLETTSSERAEGSVTI